MMRAAQSKGIVDLLALWPVDYWHDMRSASYPVRASWLVQCKHSIKGGGYLPAREAIELVALAKLTGAVPVFARPGKNGRGVEFINLNSKESIG